MKAVSNFIDLNGDVDFYSINRQQTNKLKTFWLERILKEEVTRHTAKKDFNNLSVICSDYANHIGDFDFKNSFSNIKFDETKSKIRPPFSIQMIDSLINTELFKTMNFEAHMAFMASVDTGLRPSEITRLPVSALPLRFKASNLACPASLASCLFAKSPCISKAAHLCRWFQTSVYSCLCLGRMLLTT